MSVFTKILTSLYFLALLFLFLAVILPHLLSGGTLSVLFGILMTVTLASLTIAGVFNAFTK